MKKEKHNYILKKQEIQTGIIHINTSGFGFIDLPNKEKSIFIPPRFINNALNGDIVKIKLKKNDSRGPIGKVINIIGSSYEKVSGQFFIKNKQYYINPLQKNIQNIKIKSLPKSFKLKEGDWLEVKIKKERIDNQLEGIIFNKIETNNKLLNELQATIQEFDLGNLYPKETEEYAKSLQPRPIKRKNLCNEVTLTIDPIDAKDFDDALSIHNNSDQNKIIIGVHIADVATYISPNDKLQKLIRDHSFTAYLPGKTIPMLPEVLVQHRCSLIEQKDKFAHTILLHIEKNTGKIIKSERFHSIINVNKQLNYKEIQEFIDNDFKHPKWEKTIQETVKFFFIISKILRKFREKHEKFLKLSNNSFEIICNYKKTSIEKINEKKSLPSHNLVEEFMLATNVEVAKELIKKDIPGIFRTHDAPDEDRLIQLSIELSLAFQLNTNNLIHRNEVNKLLKKIENHQYQQIISFKILRTMKRANYQNQTAFHYGLGKSLYSHFTSPIRRYSDLLIHQQLWNFDTKTKLFNKNFLAKEVVFINRKEEKIDLANREITNRFKMHYIKKILKNSPNETFKAIISEIKKNGFSIYLNKFGIYSFIAYNTCSNEYTYNEKNCFFYSAQTGKTFYCGEIINIIINNINFKKYELIIDPVL